MRPFLCHSDSALVNGYWFASNWDVITVIKSGGSFLFRLLTVVLYSDTSGAGIGC